MLSVVEEFFHMGVFRIYMTISGSHALGAAMTVVKEAQDKLLKSVQKK